MSSWISFENLKCDNGTANDFISGVGCGSVEKPLLEQNDDSVWAVSFEYLTERAGETDEVETFENVGCGEEKHGEREFDSFRPRRLRQS